MPTADITIWKNVDVATIRKVAEQVGWEEFLEDTDTESPTYGQKVIPNTVTFGDFLRTKLRNVIKAWLLDSIKQEHETTQDHQAVLNNLLTGATD